MSDGLSVVICCHNSSRRLPETLRHLAGQHVPAGLPWEVLLIDNASSDDTVETARRLWPASAPAPLRIVSEPKLGLANARFRSYSEARYELISFVDDDNWVEPDWVSKVTDFFRDHPEAMAVGGSSRAIFEKEPPAWFAKISSFYAIGTQHTITGDITDRPGTLLWGAGLSLRKKGGLDLIHSGFRILLCGGDDLAIQTGEDTELCFALRASGGRLFHEPKLVLSHFMPADRLTWLKALKLMRTMGEASPILDLYLTALNVFPGRGRPEWKKSWLFFLLKAVREWMRICLQHPWDCVRRPEGSLPALKAEKARSTVATLWALRRRYGVLRQQIENAPWARRAEKTGR